MGCFLNRDQYPKDIKLTIILKKQKLGNFTWKVQKDLKNVFIKEHNRLRAEHRLK